VVHEDLELPDPEKEGTTILRNIRIYWPNDSAQYAVSTAFSKTAGRTSNPGEKGWLPDLHRQEYGQGSGTCTLHWSHVRHILDVPITIKQL